MIRETIREMGKVAIGRVVLTSREHIIALEAMDKGLIGTLLRYPYEVRDPAEYFDDIQDVKVTKDTRDIRIRGWLRLHVARISPSLVSFGSFDVLWSSRSDSPRYRKESSERQSVPPTTTAGAEVRRRQ